MLFLSTLPSICIKLKTPSSPMLIHTFHGLRNTQRQIIFIAERLYTHTYNYDSIL